MFPSCGAGNQPRGVDMRQMQKNYLEISEIERENHARIRSRHRRITLTDTVDAVCGDLFCREKI
jgi:hypothetical protein